MDRKVREAVEAAVRRHNQPDKVAKRMLNFLEELSQGIANLDRTDDVRVSLETILDGIDADDSEWDEEI